jgi:spore germination protein YaaH
MAFSIGLPGTAVQAAPKKPVLGFYASWAPPSPVHYSKISHLMFAFLFPSAGGQVTGPAVPSNVVSSAHAAGVKVIASVGGANHSTVFPSMAANASARTTFANSMRDYINSNGIDGVDIDWEYPANAQDSANLTLLLKAVRSAVGTSKLITMDMAPTHEKGQWVSKSSLEICDFYNVMAYDFTGSFPGSVVGQHSTYNHGVLGVTYWKNRGAPRERVIMGVPFYGKNFDAGGAAVDYKDIMAANPNISPDADSVGRTWFNGVTTMKKKSAYVAQQGYGGVMIWQLAGDAPAGSKSLLDAIETGYNTPASILPRQAGKTGFRSRIISPYPLAGSGAGLFDLGGRSLSVGTDKTRLPAGVYIRTPASPVATGKK